MFPIVILAGGLATRLRPITEKVPKSLIGINGAPFVLHQLELLKLKGFEEIHFCLGYLGEQVEKEVRESKYYKILKITFSYDGEILLGTGGAIRKIIDNLPKYFFVTYGDSYLDVNYSEIQKLFELKNKKYNALMTVYKNNDLLDKSNVIFENGLIELYSKSNKDSKMSYIDYGVGIVSAKCIEVFDKNCNFDLATIYENLSLKKELLGYEILHRFYEIGSLQGIHELTNFLKLNSKK